MLYMITNEDRIKKLIEVQTKAEQQWINNGRRGTVEMATGTGKTRVVISIASKYPKDAKILYLSETLERETDVRVQLEDSNYQGAPFQFHCYQSAYKWYKSEWDLVIADEIHDSLSQEYSKFYFNNNFKDIIGLSATIPRDDLIDGLDETKEELLNKVAPICFTYSAEQARVDQVLPPLKVHVINHYLDDSVAYLSGQNGSKITEAEKFAGLQQAIKYNMTEGKPYMVSLLGREKAKFIQSLRSKAWATTELLKHISGSTLIFSVDLKLIEEVTDNVISSKNKNKKGKERNRSLREQLENKEIDVIGAFKMLKQGANIKGLENIVMMSYYSKPKDYTQITGRIRFMENFTGEIYIFKTYNTKEKRWFESMIGNVDKTNFIYYDGIEDFIKKQSDENKTSETKKENS